MIVNETQLLAFLQSFATAEPVPVPLRVVEATERTPRGPPRCHHGRGAALDSNHALQPPQTSRGGHRRLE